MQQTPLGSFSNTPAENIALNLALVNKYAREALDHYCQIIVFPECLQWNYAFTGKNPRETTREYSEQVPALGANPCKSKQLFPDSPQLRNASCAARNTRVVLVMNMVDYVPCNSTDPNCPSDGFYLYNTNVVFDEEGALIAVYHKSHLFGEAPYINQPAVPDVVNFTTSFGVTFGMFICYDIEFAGPAAELVALGIRDFVYNTEWLNSPIVSAPQVQQGWSRLFNASIVASAVQGGGIFSKGNPIAFQFNPNATTTSQLLVGVVSTEAMDEQVEEREPEFSGTVSAVIQTVCTASGFDEAAPCALFLTAPGAVYVANLNQGSLLCEFHATIAAGSQPEQYYAMMVIDRVYSFPGTPDPAHIQSCFIIPCPTNAPHSGNVTCPSSYEATGMLAAFTIFGNYAPNVEVFPLVSVSGGAVIDTRQTIYDATGFLASNAGEWDSSNKLLSATLYGLVQ